MDGLAIDRQREDCENLARFRRWEVVEIYVDQSKSATNRTAIRPDYDRMVADYLLGRFDAIICYDLDRLPRQPRQLEDWIDAAELRGLALVTANGDADLSTDGGRMYACIKAAVASAEMEPQYQTTGRSVPQWRKRLLLKLRICVPNNEFGDFQTPLGLATQCLTVLGLSGNARIFEPTCGQGSFLEAATKLAPDSERFGVEINPEYSAHASKWGMISTANVFQITMPDAAAWEDDGPLFVVGNPPWVTAAELKRMDSENLPPKENFKQVKGLDALLGASNFDVCEYIILKALREFSGQQFMLGMLCKTQVARNVIEYASTIALPIANAAIYRIDALRWFGAGVDACWFTVEVNPTVDEPDYTVSIFQDVFEPGARPVRRFGVVDSLLVSDVDKYMSVRQADGKSPYVWRSGLKHDASSVFELVASPQPTTKKGVQLDLEPEYVFPFLKSTDVFRGRHRVHSKWVIVPQMEFGADTKHLRTNAPKLWNYFKANAEALDGRKSTIYKNRPRFSVFGHGEYTFAPYKVAVSGLHKEPVFRLVSPLNDQPVVLDDTCYLLPFDDPTEAAVVTAILNSPECVALINSLVFWDSKRPITKKLLSRLDLNRLPVNADVIAAEAEAEAQALMLPFNPDRAIGLIGRLGETTEPVAMLF